MDLIEIKQELEKMAKRLAEIRGSLDLEAKQARIRELEEQMAAPDFWDDQKAAQTVINEANALKDLVGEFQSLEERFENLEVTYELIKEEPDEDLQQELVTEAKRLTKDFSEFELQLLLNEPYDKNNAILELHPGAGGTESQDWASMLLRMYTRWAEKKGFKVETLDYLPGEEAGIKSVTLLIKGHNAYGYLKAEKGVHRLVRISPFDASGRRHTSFVSCEVIPEMDDDIEIEIRPEEIRIDTYRSSGAGGQHVNTTDSAVRITHIPTGIVVTCQSERSQIKNREKALNMLKAKLYQKKLEEQQAELAEIRGEQKEIGWGNQIRSYVFHPYSLVKDHRTNVEVGNVQAVMDGEIDIFIDAYLRSKLK
ncbi:peptide chain release factor 2 [Parageobacillus thermoglucosidasius]|uniref:peptide chain release factor 2 n=1 Tax=Parageobacillus thermoglucosidasius TaxID=1426 RepID=UPI000BEFC8E9|nr:peptide chain release factor 2 [Parageobacillus thermoglucosidasius]REK56492.1 MAG: peptide chain release factor 2 [Geobacillus sp.]MED4905480.1 peptide chain release factor 2 [Parageobacillus thermoglucosidasius]MED4913879.1 peptide chain release factor 2 [Parageobacillus thermoglucosidasius]MED4943858.1 peptide chain release factor 2 [Parageobacillus thermoglucosidasius]MED4983624.1 peptide chain release factor 2 [Parageobacillus thermoglucosidasius]